MDIMGVGKKVHLLTNVICPLNPFEIIRKHPVLRNQTLLDGLESRIAYSTI
jgi:hypothetical protein